MRVALIIHNNKLLTRVVVLTPRMLPEINDISIAAAVLTGGHSAHHPYRFKLINTFFNNVFVMDSRPG